MSAAPAPRPPDYSPSEGSHLEGLDYAQLDVSDPKAIENFKPSFDRLDVLVLAQGAVIYRRGEFQMDGISQGARSQSDEPDGLRRQIP